MATNNAINLTAAGLAKYDGAGTFSGVTVTQYDVLVGAASNGITSVAPSATAGVPLISGGASADPSFGTVVVAGGGTGLATLTAYELLSAGTTATGALQQIALGTAGQVLTSAGAGALAAYADIPAPSSLTPYSNVTGTTQLMAVNKGYVASNASLVTFTPPAVCAVGTRFAIVGGAAGGGWSINLTTNTQTANFGNQTASTALASSNANDCLELVCVTANTAFAVSSTMGNISFS